MEDAGQAIPLYSRPLWPKSICPDMTQSTTFMIPQTIGNILCCKCAIPIVPNRANMCVACLRSEVDITEGLRKHIIMVHCPNCDRYLEPPSTWIKARLESNELLSFCCRKLQKSCHKNSIRLVAADFVWTEPHSKRIEVKLKIQKEVINGAILEQTVVVEYILQDHMCGDCSRVQTNPDQWVAAVQLRQHVTHRRSIFYVEQLILKHSAAVHATKIMPVDQGIDLFFAHRSHAMKFVEFLGKVALLRNHHDKQLVSHDCKNNKYNYKYTFSCEICPICREDLICLPPRIAASLGNLGPFVICTKATNNLTLLDPFTLRQSSLNADQYWRAPFRSLFTSRQLVEYIVLDVEPVSYDVNSSSPQYKLADVQVARMSDFGRNNNILYIRTHLGHLLNAGDHALGYDISGANTNDMELDKYKGLDLPEAILIKKSYGEKHTSKGYHMEVDEPKVTVAQNNMMTEYEEFLRDLEENPELRFNLSLFDNGEFQPSESPLFAIEQNPSVPLVELLKDLVLSEEEDGDDSMRE